MKHIILSLLLVLGVPVQAQTRLSEMPWSQRDSIITAKVKKHFRDVQKHNYDDCVSIIRQKDNDRYNVSWVAEIYNKAVKETGVWRAFVPSDLYLYDVKLFGECVSMEGKVYNGLKATALVDENLEVLMTSMTDDVTLYSYKYENDDCVTGVFDNPTRRSAKYKRPTDAELRTDEYAWGKSIASLSKDERIRVLTGLRLMPCRCSTAVTRMRLYYIRSFQKHRSSSLDITGCRRMNSTCVRAKCPWV